MGIAGYATPEGTQRYRDRMVKSGIAHATHFKDGPGGLALSSIGLGTYLGGADEKTDGLYLEAVKQAAVTACNVFDSAINYRCQRSERVIGQALESIRGKTIARDEVVIATKGGFLPFDGTPPQDAYSYFEKSFISPGIIDSRDIVAECHCMTPAYLRHQLQASLMNLGLECVDIYYLHNPETQLDEMPHDEFMKRMRAAFETLEQVAEQGKLRMYGMATWNGFRIQPGAQGHLSLEALVKLAEEVGGARHHFKIIQAPFNVGMLEALAQQTQMYQGKPVSLLEAAKALDIYVVASVSILQGQLTKNLPDHLRKPLGDKTDAQRSIQFVRSTPGLGTALVGMKQAAHVRENLAVAQAALLTADQFATLFA